MQMKNIRVDEEYAAKIHWRIERVLVLATRVDMLKYEWDPAARRCGTTLKPHGVRVKLSNGGEYVVHARAIEAPWDEYEQQQREEARLQRERVQQLRRAQEVADERAQRIAELLEQAGLTDEATWLCREGPGVKSHIEISAAALEALLHMSGERSPSPAGALDALLRGES